MEIDLPKVSIKGINFNKMPEPVYADTRPKYRVALIIYLIIRFSKNTKKGKCLSYFQINTLTWLVNNQNEIDNFVNNTLNCFSLDPVNVNAINYGIAFDLLIFQNGFVYLLDKGIQLNDLVKDKGIFEEYDIILKPINKNLVCLKRISNLYKG